VAGEVIEANDALSNSPELVNSDPYGQGWMIRVRVADSAAADGLRDADSYRSLIEAG
jgi:glycine cleavage system H protein